MVGCKAVIKSAADCLFLPRGYVAAGSGAAQGGKSAKPKEDFPFLAGT